MWRYYELLTDISAAEIAAMRARAVSGEMNPKIAKMDLARQIIADFHSATDAQRAADEWQRVVSSGEIPSDLETLAVSEPAVRIDKLLARAGLADSVSDAVRKLKAGAVEVDGERVSDLRTIKFPGKYVLRAGRKWKQVSG
jgi:tyrosyl-tRNA synthetase